MSEPVPQMSFTITWPVLTGLVTTTLSSTFITSIIMPLGTGRVVFTAQRGCRPPSVRTVLVTMRVGLVSSSLP